MENLKIKGTKSTMEVDFNKETGMLKLSGSSYPENTLDFFAKISSWIKEYFMTVNKPIELNINLNYINTSSTKCLLDVFETFNYYHQQGLAVRINWHYQEDDEDILETGEELAEDFTFPITFIPYR